MQSVKSVIFFETIATEIADVHLDKVGDVVVHVITGLKGVIFIPVFYEDIPGESVAVYLDQLGMLDLLPFLVPDHPASELAKKLTRKKL